MFKKGNEPWNKGRTNVYSEEHLKYMSDILKGRKLPTRREDWCKNISISKSGENNPSVKRAKKYEAFGEEKTISQWFNDERCKVKTINSLRNRIVGGWPVEKAITTPPRKGKKKGRNV